MAGGGVRGAGPREAHRTPGRGSGQGGWVKSLSVISRGPALGVAGPWGSGLVATSQGHRCWRRRPGPRRAAPGDSGLGALAQHTREARETWSLFRMSVSRHCGGCTQLSSEGSCHSGQFDQWLVSVSGSIAPGPWPGACGRQAVDVSLTSEFLFPLVPSPLSTLHNPRELPPLRTHPKPHAATGPASLSSGLAASAPGAQPARPGRAPRRPALRPQAGSQR